MSTLTREETVRIAETIAGMPHLSRGVGNRHSACSIAAINIALSNRVTDVVPDCMSQVMGEWIISIQDTIPDEMRNSQEWRDLLPLAAGTGREDALEERRTTIILDWMWEIVLPLGQPYADAKGFGQEWSNMVEVKTEDAARVIALNVENLALGGAANMAAIAAKLTSDRSKRSEAVNFAAFCAYGLSRLAPARDDFWAAINPPKLLRKLIEVGQDEKEPNQ